MTATVSENIDRLLRQMTDVATGDPEYALAREAFYTQIRRDNNDTEAWWKAIVAALGVDTHRVADLGSQRDQDIYSAAESLVMGGVDLAGSIKDPENYVPNTAEHTRTSAWHEFIGVGLPEMVARRLVDLWEEYYRSIELDESKNKSTKGFEQIGGDFGDPWSYGGTWFDPQSGTIVHFDGLDSGETGNDVDADDKKIDSTLTQADYQNITKDLQAERDEAWEDTESTIREAHAEVFNANRQFPVYRTVVEEDATIESDWADDIVSVKDQWGDKGEEIWAGMSPANKMAELAGYKGWYEFDYDSCSYTKAELSAFLGINL